jgi:thiol-disulfide isomerase/thioredoxin
MVEKSRAKPFNGTMGDLSDQIGQVDDLTVLVFHAPWCLTCRRVLQFLPAIAADFPPMQFLVINVDLSKEISKALNVHIVPAFKIFRKEAGELKLIESGFGSKGMNIRDRLTALRAAQTR